MRTTNSLHGSKASWRTCLVAALICVTCAWATTSCSTGTKATRDALPQAAPPPPPPGPQANQRQQCPALPPARSDLVPDLLANHDQVVGLYHDCSARTSSLLDSIDEWGRTALSWYCSALDRMHLVDGRCPKPAK